MIEQNFVKIYEDSFKNNWELPALSDFSEKISLNYSDLAREIARMHILLEKAGVEKGDKIALVGKNNIPWCVVYLAVIHYGGVIVPILQDFHIDNVTHIINHSESKLLFVGDQIWNNMNEADIPLVEAAFSTNDLSFSFLYQKCGIDMGAVVSSLESEMDKIYANGFSKQDIQYNNVDNSELVLINYTSGTTGFSKGVMLTANSLAGNVTYAHHLKLLLRGQNIVSFLPLAHAYGCAFEFLYSLSTGAHTTLLGKAPTPVALTEAFAEVKPSLIISVPLIIEKIYRKAILPKIEKPSIKFLLKIPILRNRVYAKIRKGLMDALGGNFHEIIIGGAALNKDVEAFLCKIKFPLTVGYGMTECGPLISYDHNHEFIPTSCGKILDGIMEVRIDSPDPYNTVGEIQVRGENVMIGYYKNEEATKAAFTDDGWLRTGDLGTIDMNNRIFIRGRIKNMILGSGGQNIYPEEIEARLNNMLYVAESVVIERGGKLVALVYPDYETLLAEGISNDRLLEIMENNKTLLNKSVASYENVAAIQIFSDEFEKTPKKSIKRYLYENQ